MRLQDQKRENVASHLQPHFVVQTKRGLLVRSQLIRRSISTPSHCVTVNRVLANRSCTRDHSCGLNKGAQEATHRRLCPYVPAVSPPGAGEINMLPAPAGVSAENGRQARQRQPGNI